MIIIKLKQGYVRLLAGLIQERKESLFEFNGANLNCPRSSEPPQPLSKPRPFQGLKALETEQ